MKIQVSNLRANPFRRITKYPIDRDKIKGLKASIKETTFWDNIICRKVDSLYEIAYGHHRLVAIKELGIEEVNIPVRDIDDAAMIKIMANENRDSWKCSPAVINETVWVVRDYLNKELAKYKTWEEMSTAGKNTSGHFPKDEHRYGQLRIEGVGRETILKFLGETYQEWEIKSALNTLDLHKSKFIDRKVVETLPLSKGDRFKTAVIKSNIPRKKQAELAEELRVNEVPTKEIEEAVRDYGKKLKVKPKDIEPKPLPMLDDYVKETIKVYNDAEVRSKRIRGKLDNIQNSLTRENFILQAKCLRNILNEMLPEN